jgi:BolA protein
MMAQAAQLHQRLTEHLQPFSLEVIDESADHAGHAGSNGLGHGTHIRVRIGSVQFAGLPRVKRHRRVYDALQDFIDQGLHALAIEIVDPSPSGAGQSHNRP